jgi:tetratricopeptide (TPR) repeat protein
VIAGTSLVVGLLSLLFVAGPWRRARPERLRPEDVPAPLQAELLDPPVQAQFGERRAAVLRLLADPGVAAEPLADALGELGMAFHAYAYRAKAEACYGWAVKLAPRSFRWAYAAGVVRQEQGNGPDAADTFRRALALEPENVPARVRLADLAAQSGKGDEAESLYREALARDPDCAPAQVGLARLALERRRPAEAVDLLQRALAWQPDAVAIHQALGLAYRDLGDRDRARQHLRRVPDQKMAQEALPMADPFQAALDAARVGARGHDLRAMRAMNEGRFELAAIEFRQALLADPDRVYARHGLALALSRSGKHEEAVVALEELLRRDPSHAASRLLLSRVLAAQGRLAAARTGLEALLKESPGDAEARSQLADVCFEQGDLRAALDHYTRALALAPERTEARLGAGLTLVRLGQRRRALDVLLEEGPQESLDPQVALLAARLLSGSPEPELRDAERALTLARQAWQAAPTLSAAESMAMAEAEKGRLRAATAWQREAASVSGTRRPWVAKRLARYESGQPAREPWAPGEDLSRAHVLPPDVEARTP